MEHGRGGGEATDWPARGDAGADATVLCLVREDIFFLPQECHILPKNTAFAKEIFFLQFKGPVSNSAVRPHGRILDLINRCSGSFVDFKRDFKEAAMKIQGSGWVYLSRNGSIRTITNHQKRTDIALLVDWWEHAWVNDYQSNKEKYLDNIWRIMDWDAINRRL